MSSTQTATISNKSYESPVTPPVKKRDSGFFGIYANLGVRIHSNIADAGNWMGREGQNAISLWYLVRMVDTKGSGKARIELDSSADHLGVSKQTILRYLKTGIKKGFFRSVKRKRGGNDVDVYYSSAVHVALSLGLDGLGIVTEVKGVDLRHLKYYTTQAVTEALQRRSVVKAKVSTETYLSITTSLNSTRGNWWYMAKSNGKAFVSASFKSFGTSLENVAEYTGRSKATVQRRLSNIQRKKVNRKIDDLCKKVEYVAKRQLIQQVTEEERIFELQELGVSFYRDPIDKKVYFFSNGSWWKTNTNIYTPIFHINSPTYLKKKFRNRMSEASHSDSGIKGYQS